MTREESALDGDFDDFLFVCQERPHGFPGVYLFEIYFEPGDIITLLAPDAISLYLLILFFVLLYFILFCGPGVVFSLLFSSCMMYYFSSSS